MAKDSSTRNSKSLTSEAGGVKIAKSKKGIVETTVAPAKKRKATDDVTTVKVKKTRQSSKPSAKEVESASEPIEKSSAIQKPELSKTIKKIEQITIVAEDAAPTTENDLLSEEDEDSEFDDQTNALLRGFESDGDNEDALNEEGLKEGQEIPKRKTLDKRQEKALQKAATISDSEKPGVIYIGRIPHGFYEYEMRSYFKQFGNILKLRLSRNKKTGKSKHYAWIQFESAIVAEIVAKTMDNYLLFGHLLKVKLIPEEQVPEDLFKGANKRFKKVPWNKMAGRKLAQPQSEKNWDERVEREKKRREEKAAKLKAIGYEFDSPELKSASEVVKKAKALPEPVIVEKTLVIEAPAAIEELIESKQRMAKSLPKPEESVETDEVSIDGKKIKKTKKVKKQKALP